jgi:hypothetical protein
MILRKAKWDVAWFKWQSTCLASMRLSAQPLIPQKKKIKNSKMGQAQWLTPIIPAIQEVGRIMV